MPLQSNVVMEPRQWYLKTSTSKAYYMLMVAELDGRYYLLQRHGKMGARVSLSVGFSGVVIGDKGGYDSLDEAYAEGEKVIDRKCRQAGARQYCRLSEDESYVYHHDDEGRMKVLLSSVDRSVEAS